MTCRNLADRFFRDKKFEEAAGLYQQLAESEESPEPALCLRLARCWKELGDLDLSESWAMRVASGDHFPSWQQALRFLQSVPTLRLAIIGSHTTTHLAQALQLCGAERGIPLEIYEAPYGQIEQEILDLNSGLYRFQPEQILIAPQVECIDWERHEGEADRWAGYWEVLSERTGAKILQQTFVVPNEEPFGHLAQSVPESCYRRVQQINRRLTQLASEKVSLCNVDWLASRVGKGSWRDQRYWHLAKEPVAPKHLPLLARETMALVLAQQGKSRKLLLLDLDNTLWGGVIGEDGVDEIRLGGDPVGEAFIRFQHHIHALQKRGVILAVCSKNNEEDAKKVFLEHPECILSLEDFSLFCANWEPKAVNIEQIATELNLGLDSVLFVDDNPIERQAVRAALPDVDVLSLPQDPTGYTEALANYPFLEASSYTAEDQQRTKQYQARAEAQKLRSSANSLEEFYRGLEMKALIIPLDEKNLTRATQLVSKSNQFNLTTKRYSASDLKAMAEEPGCYPYLVRLKDRLTDHGLISVVIGKKEGATFTIDTFLMSCRVMGRQLEETIVAHLADQAKAEGCSQLRGEYRPTPKNHPVSDLYTRFGFQPDGDSDGTTLWRLPLDKAAPTAPSTIELVTEEEEWT